MSVSAAPAASVDELLDAARAMARGEGAVPSKERLKKAFRIGHPRASEIHARLVAERANRRAEARKNLRRVAARKGAGRPLPVRFSPLPAVPLSPGMGPVAPMSFAQPTAVEKGGVAPVTAPLPDPSPAIDAPARRVVTWPAQLVLTPAYVAIWAGWVALGKMTGFGRVNLLPGFGRGWVVDTAITLPIGVEAYAMYAMYVALNPAAPDRARRFAWVSSAVALLLGAGGQVAYHVMAAAGMERAPWQITTVVSCLPVAVAGMVAALVYLVRVGHR